MKASIAAALAVLASCAWAQPTPAGLWKTVDDGNGQEKSHVRLVDDGGAIVGRVERLLDPGRQDARCDKCSDARKGQPVLGMTIVEGVRKADGGSYWEGGTILDPENGKTYRVRLTPLDGGKSLQVRGYIGPFYRNQTWLRVE